MKILSLGNRRTVLLALVLILAMATYSSAAEKPIELKLAQYFASAQWHSKIVADWAKKIETESNGRLRITIFPDSSLLSGPETWQGTVRGVADICSGWIKGFGKEGMVPYHLSTATLAAIYGTKGAAEVTKIGDELMKVFPPFAQEVDDLKHFANFSLQNVVLYSRNFAVRSVADIKGRTIRAGNNAVSDIVKYFGGSPLFMAMPEVFMALQKGTIDMNAGFGSNLKAYRHGDIARYATLTLIPGAGVSPGSVGMNWDIWKKLPPDLQKVFEANSNWLNDKLNSSRRDEEIEGLEYVRVDRSLP